MRLSRPLPASIAAAPKADAYPAQLSGGQQRRIAIALAMDRETDVARRAHCGIGSRVGG